jgi:hypothetical protein
MIDRSFSIWLMVIFGVSGLGVVLLAWLLPSLRHERMTATLVGLVGIGMAVTRGLMLRKSPESDDMPLGVPVEEED